MAVPCCPKCSNTHFVRSKNHPLKVIFIHCSACGAVVSAVPLRKSSGGATKGTGGTTTVDDWESPV